MYSLIILITIFEIFAPYNLKKLLLNLSVCDKLLCPIHYFIIYESNNHGSNNMCGIFYLQTECKYSMNVTEIYQDHQFITKKIKTRKEYTNCLFEPIISYLSYFFRYLIQIFL